MCKLVKHFGTVARRAVEKMSDLWHVVAKGPVGGGDNVREIIRLGKDYRYPGGQGQEQTNSGAEGRSNSP